MTDNQYRAAEDRFLVMAVKSRERIHEKDTDKIDKAWRSILKTEENKEKAEYMQQQYSEHYLTRLFTFVFIFHSCFN